MIVFDFVGFGEIAEKLRKQGKQVIGGTVYTDKLELDREFGQHELKRLGVSVLPHWHFDSFAKAIHFVSANPARYVVKPNSFHNEKELLFVGQEEDGQDVLCLLKHYKKALSAKISDLQLQRHVAGVEIAVGAFFNGKEFTKPICVNFEHKKLFDGEVGPSTGEMGTLVYWDESPLVFEQTLEKFKGALQQSGYVGYIDLNCMVNSHGIRPLEFTSRFGYPTISIQMEGVESPWGDFLFSLSRGEPCSLKTKKGFQIGVVIAVPPFPFIDHAAFRKYSEDAMILFKKDLDDGVHLGDVKLAHGSWRLAGYSGYALVVTGSGSTVEEARHQAYGRVRNITIPNMFYRTDIGLRWMTESDKLHTWGYL